MRIDVHAAIGRFPFRDHPPGTVRALEATMARVGIDEAWVSHLSAVFWRDPSAGNAELFTALRGHSALRPVPTLLPGFPGWERVIDQAQQAGSPAVRVDPTIGGVDPVGSAMIGVASACAERDLPLLMVVKLEDLRQRHPADQSPALEPAMIRTLIRAAPTARLIVAAADRDFVEQVHWGAKPSEAERILWEISWIWGPPEDHLEHLLGSVGAERFCFGTGHPLRIAESSVVKLELSFLSTQQRARIESENVRSWSPRSAG